MRNFRNMSNFHVNVLGAGRRTHEFAVNGAQELMRTERSRPGRPRKQQVATGTWNLIVYPAGR
jgi:hypothetical protein